MFGYIYVVDMYLGMDTTCDQRHDSKTTVKQLTKWKNLEISYVWTTSEVAVEVDFVTDGQLTSSCCRGPMTKFKILFSLTSSCFLSSLIYIPEEQSGPVIPPGTGLPFCHLAWLPGLWWRYSDPPPTWVWVELMLWPTVSRPIRLGFWLPLGAHDQIFLFSFFCQTIALPFILGHPLWWEDGSVICSAICQWSKSYRTHNHTLLSHLRLLGSLSIASYDLQGLQ
jgi:hypothetical protein